MDHKPTVEIDEIIGIIERFLFQSPENGFCVFVLTHKKNEPVTVRGTLPNISAGQQVTLQGVWVMHPKFGKQFEANKCTTSLPTSVVGLKKYLGSGLIKGIGKIYAEKLVNHFGMDVLEVIDKTPFRLKEVPGIGHGRVSKIATAWKDQKSIANIMVFLQEKDISPALATKIYKKYGQQSLEILQENPYRLADEMWGIGFKTADTLAQKMGFDQTSVKRFRAGILFTITQGTNTGNLYVELQKLRENTCKLLELNLSEHEPKIKHALHELYDEEKIKLLTHDDKHYITLSQYYYTEKGVSKKIKKLLDYESKYTFDLNEMYQFVRTKQNEYDVELEEEQQKGILSCLENKISIITGDQEQEKRL